MLVETLLIVLMVRRHFGFFATVFRSHLPRSHGPAAEGAG
jgi:hypothetical protein